jgi:hypothetical protein
MRRLVREHSLGSECEREDNVLTMSYRTRESYHRVAEQRECALGSGGCGGGDQGRVEE